MTSIYQLTEDIVALEKLLEEQGGDVTDGSQGAVLEKWMEEYDLANKVKIDGYAAVIRNREGYIKAIDAEIQRLGDRKKTFKNQIDRLKALVKWAMERRGLKKIEGNSNTFLIQRNGGAKPLILQVEAIEQYPERFIAVHRSIDQEKLREALEKGDTEAAKFAKIGDAGDHIRLK